MTNIHSGVGGGRGVEGQGATGETACGPSQVPQNAITFKDVVALAATLFRVVPQDDDTLRNRMDAAFNETNLAVSAQRDILGVANTATFTVQSGLPMNTPADLSIFVQYVNSSCTALKIDLGSGNQYLEPWSGADFPALAILGVVFFTDYIASEVPAVAINECQAAAKEVRDCFGINKGKPNVEQLCRDLITHAETLLERLSGDPMVSSGLAETDRKIFASNVALAKRMFGQPEASEEPAVSPGGMTSSTTTKPWDKGGFNAYHRGNAAVDLVDGVLEITLNDRTGAVEIRSKEHNRGDASVGPCPVFILNVSVTDADQLSVSIADRRQGFAEEAPRGWMTYVDGRLIENDKLRDQREKAKPSLIPYLNQEREWLASMGINSISIDRPGRMLLVWR